VTHGSQSLRLTGPFPSASELRSKFRADERNGIKARLDRIEQDFRVRHGRLAVTQRVGRALPPRSRDIRRPSCPSRPTQHLQVVGCRDPGRDCGAVTLHVD
jgi:hypothetical protein